MLVGKSVNIFLNKKEQAKFSRIVNDSTFEQTAPRPKAKGPLLVLPFKMDATRSSTRASLHFELRWVLLLRDVSVQLDGALHKFQMTQYQLTRPIRRPFEEKTV